MRRLWLTFALLAAPGFACGGSPEVAPNVDLTSLRLLVADSLQLQGTVGDTAGPVSFVLVDAAGDTLRDVGVHLATSGGSRLLSAGGVATVDGWVDDLGGLFQVTLLLDTIAGPSRMYIDEVERAGGVTILATPLNATMTGHAGYPWFVSGVSSRGYLVGEVAHVSDFVVDSAWDRYRNASRVTPRFRFPPSADTVLPMTPVAGGPLEFWSERDSAWEGTPDTSGAAVSPTVYLAFSLPSTVCGAPLSTVTSEHTSHLPDFFYVRINGVPFRSAVEIPAITDQAHKFLLEDSLYLTGDTISGCVIDARSMMAAKQR